MSENVYTNAGANCDVTLDCFLDDPYEGELFAVMMYLFAPLDDANKEAIWTGKRYKLNALNYHIEETN